MGPHSKTVRHGSWLHRHAANILAGLALAGFAAPAAAATQGTIGATSQGSITITATVPNRAHITGLTDINFTNADPTSNAVSSQNDCVWSNTATKGYSIKATGSGTAGAFTLASGALAPVPYSVQWNQSSGQSAGTALVADTPLSGLVSTATTPTCSSGPASTSSLIVSIASSDLQTMVAATSYTGTLTLLVTPQ
ncbi:hypothetical protein [Sphingobium sp.]|uniref:hypothetical protein n=1 Tax=Sphingobium sp. TaxID=1912891 RepID=UPI0025DA395D|nr:hypothetical protein [Sphingobium sp.]